MYWLIYVVYWLMFGLILATSPLNTLAFVQVVDFPKWADYLLISTLATLVLATVLPLIASNREPVYRTIVEQFNNRRFAFPTTPKEQLMYLLVAITVGIVEEFMFRGFLLQYLRDLCELSILTSFLIVSVIFGIGHFTQGISGIVFTFLLGLGLGYLYLVTGSIIPGIIVHTLFDLKILAVSKIVLTREYKEAPLT